MKRLIVLVLLGLMVGCNGFDKIGGVDCSSEHAILNANCVQWTFSNGSRSCTDYETYYIVPSNWTLQYTQEYGGMVTRVYLDKCGTKHTLTSDR